MTKRGRRFSGAEFLGKNRVLEKEKGKKGGLEGSVSAQNRRFVQALEGRKLRKTGVLCMFFV